MKLVTYNIQFGRGKDERFDLERIAAELEGADVVALQEVERHWRRSGDVDQPAELARLLGMQSWVYGAGVDLHAAPAAGMRRRRQFGNMLLARTPILWSRNHLLPKYASTGPMSLQRCALEGVIDTAAGPLRVYSIHLTHLSAFTRQPQVERLLALHREATREGAPITGGGLKAEWTEEGLPVVMPHHAVLMGDFNMEPDSAEYERLAGPLSPYGGRVTNPDGFVDAWVAAGHDIHAGVTARIRERPVRLDYCFVSTALAARIRAVRVDEPAQGSDHQPVWLEMDL